MTPVEVTLIVLGLPVFIVAVLQIMDRFSGS